MASSQICFVLRNANVNLKRLEKLIADTEKQKNNLISTLKLCEDDDTRRIILSELSLMDNEARELQIQLTAEESRKVKMTRHEIVFFLKDLQNGDISNIKYRKTLITVLVNKLYLYDDGRLTIVFNSGDTTTEIDVNLIEDIEKDIPVQTENRGYFLGNVGPPMWHCPDTIAISKAASPLGCRRNAKKPPARAAFCCLAVDGSHEAGDLLCLCRA